MSKIPIIENSYHGYSTGETVYIKPNDAKVLKGTVVDFQRIGNNLPIVEFNHPYKKGEVTRNAFDLIKISKTPILIIPEWRLVDIKYEYNE